MVVFPELEPGLSGRVEHLVAEESTARHLGSGSVDVLATPELVRLMEVAAVAALAGNLPAGITSVGVAMDMQHTAATPVGLRLEVSAVLTGVQGCRLEFQVVARDEVEEIGRGTHQRVLVEVEKFVARAGQKLA
jgi:fluoroacetyl-CoA thioesterase